MLFQRIILAAFIAILCCTFVTASRATDLLPVQLITNPSPPQANNATTIRVLVRNQNMLDASGFSVRVKLTRTDGGVSYDQTLTGLFLKRYSDSVFTLPVKWTPTLLDLYDAAVTVTFVDDIDLSNNVLLDRIDVKRAFSNDFDETVDLLLEHLRSQYPLRLADSSKELLAVAPT